MRYLALYRKFRPSNFEEVQGQDHIVATLQNQIRNGRMAHAYLFCGTRGTGKTTIAKILAKAVNCEHPVNGNPCNECETCRKISSGASMSVVEIDAASNNGVDNIRDIIEDVEYRPTDGKYRVYIIDEVHMLSGGAFNALLKTLEEPPEYVIFILATTEIGKIPVTILSRCQRYDFRRISLDTIAGHLKELTRKEGVEAENSALKYIAGCSDGSMRDAISLLDQCIAFNMGESLTYERVLEVLGSVDVGVYGDLLKRIVENDTSGAVRIFDEMISQGKETVQFLNDFILYMRNVLIIGVSDSPEGLVDMSGENMRSYKEVADSSDADSIMKYIRICSELLNQIRNSTNQKVLTEIAIIKMTRPSMSAENDDFSVRLKEAERREEMLLERIRLLEEKIENGRYNLPESSEVSGAGNNVSGEIFPEEEELPAVDPPASLKTVCDEWKKVVSQIKSKLTRTFLEDAHVKFNTKNPENVLYLEFKSEMAYERFKDDEIKEEISNVIRRIFGLDVSVRILTRDEGRSPEYRKVDVMKIINQKINMEIEEE
ncbi:MAG: DNA polymerase III subunit gamma/tau [Lachnospiraceae bacterium]|jgi:DNA polymerase-3 subunit gamma/tau